jgi:hypothetical protein
MTRHLLLAIVVLMTLVDRASGQDIEPPPPFNPIVRGHEDRPAVPLAQAADAIVVLIPDETFHLLVPDSQERIIRGFIVRQEKGPVPSIIVHTPHTIVNSLQQGVPARLFLAKFKDREAYYIIGVHPLPEGDKP